MKQGIKKIIIEKLVDLGYSRIKDNNPKSLFFARKNNDLVYIINLQPTRFDGFSLTSSFVPFKYYNPEKIVNFTYFTGCDVRELNTRIGKEVDYSPEYFLSTEFIQSKDDYDYYIRRLVELLDEKMINKFKSWEDILDQLSKNPRKMLDLLPMNIYKNFPEVSKELGIDKKGKLIEFHFPGAVYDTTKYQGRPIDWPKEIIPKKR